MPNWAAGCLGPNSMETFGAPKAVTHGRVALMSPKEGCNQMMSHQPCLHTCTHLPPLGWGETRRQRRQVWTCPGRLHCLAEVVAGSRAHSGPGWHPGLSPMASSDCRTQAWGLGMQQEADWGNQKRAHVDWPEGELQGRTGCSHLLFPNRCLPSRHPHHVCCFPGKADTIADSANRGWYHTGSPAG